MNIEQLAKNAINRIKSQWGLPKNGFVAGGSISNLIWEEVSGNKAVVNDIDIFIFTGFLDNYTEDRSEYLYSFKESDTDIWYDDYSGLRFIDNAKNYYLISDSITDGIYNYVNYKSNTDNPEIIIRSFDINCTAIGYSIEEDKFYWTKEYENFLKTGRLKISNLKTPCHTAIRIVKKSEDLNIKLDTFELDIIQHCLLCKYTDIYKVRFQNRYYNLFNKYSNILDKFFTIEEDTECIKDIKVKYNKDVELWTLKTNTDKSPLEIDDNIYMLNKGDELLFYLNYIYKNDNLVKIWSLLSPLFMDKDYAKDSNFLDMDDIVLLSKVIKNLPKTIFALRGYTLFDQVKILKKLLSVYKYDPIIAFSILEKHSIDPNMEIDSSTALLLELSVRKEIVDENHISMVKNIFDIDLKSTDNDSISCEW